MEQTSPAAGWSSARRTAVRSSALRGGSAMRGESALVASRRVQGPICIERLLGNGRRGTRFPGVASRLIAPEAEKDVSIE